MDKKQEGTNKTAKIMKDFLVLGLGMVAHILVGLITTPVITRLVDTADYGNYSLFSTYTELAMVVITLGLNQSLVRFFYQMEDLHYRRCLLFTCWRVPFFVCLGLGAVVLLAECACRLLPDMASPLRFFGFGTAIPLLFVLCVTALLFHRFVVLVLRLQYRSVLYSVLNVVQKLSFVGLALLFIFLWRKGSDFLLLSAAVTLSFWLVALLGILMERKLWNPTVPKDYKLPFPVSELYRYGTPMILSAAGLHLLQACGSTTLKLFHPDGSAVGIYSSAMNLVHLFALIQTTFNTIWMPLMVEHYEKNKEDKRFFQKANQAITVVLFLFGATMLVCKDIFVLLLGEKYREASYVLPFLMFYPILYTISETTQCGIVFMKKSHMHICVSLAALAVDVVACVLLVPSLGAVGAAMATAATYIVFYAARTFIGRRYYPVDFKVGRLAVVTGLFTLLCLYGSFHSFDLWLLVGYLLFCGVLLVLYRSIIANLIAFGKKYILKRFHKS